MADERNEWTHDSLDNRLEQLAQFETYSAFAHLYCRLILAWMREAEEQVPALRAACERFFDIELWYHQALADMNEREGSTVREARALVERRRINLQALSERVAAINATRPRAIVAKHLLLAECHYNLRDTQAVVADLETAIRHGGSHPLVHFALGYNWFNHARQILMEAAAAGTEDGELAEREFRSACMSAAQAFREGLSGQIFDAQLHLWIGRALAAAGLATEAQAALETAARIDPTLFAGRHDEESEAAEAPTDPITEDEVREFGVLIQRPISLDDLLQD